MDLWWICPSCGSKVNFTKEMQRGCFDKDGEAEFDVECGIFFHTIVCECNARWTMGISDVNIDK